MEAKASYRRKFAHRLGRLSASERQRQQQSIMARLLQAVDWSTIHHLSVYRDNPSWHEVATSEFISWLTNHHPHIQIDIAPQQQYAPLPEAVYDCIILPALAVDESHYRLGRGAGWYDRLLQVQPQAISICLVFREQLTDALPHDHHDQPVTMTITSDPA